MRKRITTILLLIVVGLTTCSRKQTPQAPAELTSAEYDVFSACIAGELARHKDLGHIRFVIINMTSSDHDDLAVVEDNGRFAWGKTAESLRKQAPTLQQATMDAFRKANTQQAAIGRSLQVPIDYEVVDLARIQAAFSTKNGDPWGAYYKQFPGSQGYLTLSRVGFNPDGNQALIYMTNHCGSLCAGGMYVVMEKRNGRWTISKDILIWAS